MELIDYLEILNRRRAVIIVTALFTLIAAGAAALSSPVKFTSTTTLRVLTTRAGGADYIEYDIAYTERLMQTYVAIAQSEPLMEELSRHVYELPFMEAGVVPNTELIRVSATHEDAGLAQYSVTKLAEILISNSRETNAATDRPVNIYIVEPAAIPDKPSSTNPWLVAALGLLAGTVGGLGLAFIYENLDTRIYYPHKVEALTKMDVLGEIPDDGKHLEEISRVYDSSSVHKEAFRRLRTNIFSRNHYQSIKSLMITSAVKQDGRSMVSANLAYSVACTNRTVLLIDADFRAPSIHKIFNLGEGVGLRDILNGEEGIKPVHSDYENLDILPAGSTAIYPAELLDSRRMGELLQKYTEEYSIVVIDTPSCLQVTDSAVISGYVDGVLLVLRQGWVRRDTFLATIDQLKTVDAELIGIVMNRTSRGAVARDQRSLKDYLVSGRGEPAAIPGYVEGE